MEQAPHIGSRSCDAEWYRPFIFDREIIVPELRFYLSGSLIGTVQADAVPSPRSQVTFVTESRKKGLAAGSVICFTVEGDFCEPTDYDYSGDDVVAHIDVNGYTLMKSGPDLVD